MPQLVGHCGRRQPELQDRVAEGLCGLRVVEDPKRAGRTGSRDLLLRDVAAGLVDRVTPPHQRWTRLAVGTFPKASHPVAYERRRPRRHGAHFRAEDLQSGQQLFVLYLLVTSEKEVIEALRP